MTRLLSLDLGTQTGWAVFADGHRVASGTWNLSGSRFEGGGMRYLRFERHLTDALPGVTVVAFEEVRRHAGTTAAHVYGGLLAILTKTCELAGVPYVGIPVATIKKCATRLGNAGKDRMIAAAIGRFGLEANQVDDNEADALFVGVAALEELKV